MFIELFEREDRERRLALAKRMLQEASPKPKIIPPRLVISAPRLKEAPPEPSRPERGVFRDDLAPVGWQWFKVVTASGKVGIIHLPDGWRD